MNSDSKTISMYDIFEYWKDKRITETGDIETEIDDNNIDVIVDWGEPSCFACNKFAGVDISDISVVSKNKMRKLWNNCKVSAKLQKAHIIPKALGGQAIPENMFCLCHKCHRESPDTIYSKEFFKWIYYRRKHDKYIELVLEARRQCEQEDIVPLFSMKDLNANTINSHGGYVSDATIVAGLVGIARDRCSRMVGGDYNEL